MKTNIPTFNVFYNLKDKKKNASVYIALYYSQKLTYIPTGLKITINDVNRNYELTNLELSSKILSLKNSYEKIWEENLRLDGIERSCSQLRDQLMAIYNENEKNNLIRKKVEQEDETLNFYDYAKTYIENRRKKEELSKKGTYKTYQTAVNALSDFAPNLTFQQLTSNLLWEFDAYLRTERKVTRKNRNNLIITTKNPPLNDTGVHTYMTRIRSIFNAALRFYNDDELNIIRIKHYPFKRYSLPRLKDNVKRALELSDLQRVINYQCDDTDSRRYLARDVAILSLFLTGMNTADLYNLPIQRDGNRINYNRKKTKDTSTDMAFRSLEIPVEVENLIERYRDTSGQRMFNFYRRYANENNFNKHVNIGLQQIRQDINSTLPERDSDSLPHFTTYSFRHSFATISANDLQASIYDVQFSLNHSNKEFKMTNKYIKPDFGRIDRTNRRFINYISKQSTAL